MTWVPIRGPVIVGWDPGTDEGAFIGVHAPMSQLDDDEDLLTRVGGRFGSEDEFFDYLDQREEENERRIEEVREGWHTTRNGRRSKIRYMDTSHLQNAVHFGKTKTQNSGYWEIAIPVFEAELKRRGISATGPFRGPNPYPKMTLTIGGVEVGTVTSVTPSPGSPGNT